MTSAIACLSLHQPWASLIAIGAKRIETRSWSTTYRGPLAIHAAKAGYGMSFGSMEALALDAAGYEGMKVTRLPQGGIVAVVDLVDVLPMVATGCLAGVFDDYPELDTPTERAFGNFAPGRWAWVLENVRRIHPAIPLRGRQGLFYVDSSILPGGLL